MPEEFDESWEYHTGDAEIEELLAEAASPNGLSSLWLLPSGLDDQQGFSFRPQPSGVREYESEEWIDADSVRNIVVQNPPKVDWSPVRTLRKYGSKTVPPGFILTTLWDHLRRHGINTVSRIAETERLNEGSVKTILWRGAGEWFKIVGTHQRPNVRGQRASVWARTTDEERAVYRSGKTAIDNYRSVTTRIYMGSEELQPVTDSTKQRWLHEPFLWVDGGY